MKPLGYIELLVQQITQDIASTGRQLYAIIDSAVHPKFHLLVKASVANTDYSNLFHHTEFSEIEDAAPYLIRLTEDNSSFLNKIQSLPWGILLTTSVEKNEIEAHLRSYLIAEDPLGEELLFRYYDPRVLPMFLNNSSDKERQRFFGPIEEIHVLNSQEGCLEEFTP